MNFSITWVQLGKANSDFKKKKKADKPDYTKFLKNKPLWMAKYTINKVKLGENIYNRYHR